jgi:hypothetical protein
MEQGLSLRGSDGCESERVREPERESEPAPGPLQRLRAGGLAGGSGRGGVGGGEGGFHSDR